MKNTIIYIDKNKEQIKINAGTNKKFQKIRINNFNAINIFFIRLSTTTKGKGYMIGKRILEVKKRKIDVTKDYQPENIKSIKEYVYVFDKKENTNDKNPFDFLYKLLDQHFLKSDDKFLILDINGSLPYEISILRKNN